MITADQPLQWGLVQKACKAENLIEETTAIAKQISSNGPFAIKSCKRAIDRGAELCLDDALKLELQLYDKVAHSTDAEEDLAAFLEKRAPTFEKT